VAIASRHTASAILYAVFVFVVVGGGGGGAGGAAAVVVDVDCSRFSTNRRQQ